MSELERAVILDSTEVSDLSILLYGPPGSGKTTYACYRQNKTGKLSKKFFVDVNNKLKELELPKDVRSSITVWSCDEPLTQEVRIAALPDPSKPKVGPGLIPMDQPPMGLRRTVNIINELLALARKGDFPYECVVLDELSSVSDHAVRKIMFDNRTQAITEGLWNIYYQIMLEVTSGFLQLPCERIIIGHDRRFQLRDKNDRSVVLEEYIRPNVAGQFADSICKHFTEVYYFLGRERSGSYKIQTVNDRLLTARTGSATLGAEMLIDSKTKQLVPIK